MVRTDPVGSGNAARPFRRIGNARRNSASQNRGLAVSKTYSGNETDGNFAWFDRRNGCVIVKNPDEEFLGKMKQIAEMLRAGASGTLAKNNTDIEVLTAGRYPSPFVHPELLG